MEKSGKKYSESKELKRTYEIQQRNERKLCEPVATYSSACHDIFKQLTLFDNINVGITPGDIRVVELFAGVGGFRIGLERASDRYKVVWSNQWEPSTKRQDASIIYCNRFGMEGHSNEDINTVPTDLIPESDLLVGGFPCQDYSVATTLKRSGGIEGKKGVLWWQIYRILKESKHHIPYLFFENVDRLLKSPASQRGRDFAIILASLSDLGYTVEWRVINAADYGMPQRRRRTYIVAYETNSSISQSIVDNASWVEKDGIFAKCFPIMLKLNGKIEEFNIEGKLDEVSSNFNKKAPFHIFYNAGVMSNRKVYTAETVALYDGPRINLGDILLNENEVDKSFFISDTELPRWQYLKGSKKEKRTTTDGFEYNYSEGPMAFPDYLNQPSRTIITGEGGSGPSRFKHVILSPDGRYRRLTPIELERLNMFPDNHTEGSTDSRRAFLMGNALVTGIIERVGLELSRRIK